MGRTVVSTQFILCGCNCYGQTEKCFKKSHDYLLQTVSIQVKLGFRQPGKSNKFDEYNFNRINQAIKRNEKR
jgi:hypothetical protein